MKKKLISSSFILLAALLAACSAQTALTPEQADRVVEGVIATQEVEVRGATIAELEEPVEGQFEGDRAPFPTQAPMPTQPVASFPREPETEPWPENPPGTVTPPADNYFEDYGFNPYIDTYEDHLSTFALDVDTASYAVARRYIMDGILPPPEAIRVEEFVNYFDQEYPTPPDIAFGIYADGAPAPFQPPGNYILRFGIQGYEVPEYARQPLSLTFVIDISGSMERENRLGLVKQSLQMLVDRLRPDDSVAIVAYNQNAHVILYPTGGDDRNNILHAIHSLQAGGSTNVDAGLDLGYQLAWRAFRDDGTNRVILCSDGVANVGVVNPDQILNDIRGYAEAGITLTSVGVGMGNFNDVMLEKLADQGNGNYAYVDTLDEAERIFVEDMVSTLQVIALDAKVQVDFNPDVIARYRLLGYENRAVADQDFRNDAVDAGEIGAGHNVTALYAIQFWPGEEGRIGTVQLRWQDPQTMEFREINGNFNTWDLADRFEEAVPRFQLAVLVAQYAEVLRHSPWVAGISLYGLSDQAARLASMIPWDRDVAEFADLVSRASRLY
jgi:Ca-activated chloride channel family protein